MSKFVMRFFGAVNLLFVASGLWYSLKMHSARPRAANWPPFTPQLPDWLLHFVFLMVGVALIAWLGYLSVRLTCAERKALLPTCIVFGIEIAYVWAADASYFWLIAPSSITRRSWFWTSGEDLIAPQVTLSYQFLGLLAALVLLIMTRPWRGPSQTVASYRSRL